MKKKIDKNNIKQNMNIIIIFTIIFIIFAISCISILSIARYSFPLGDDYEYGMQGRKAWEETHSVFSVIGATFKQVAYFYNYWQGTFSAIFFMALCPAIFKESLYGIGTYILLTAFVTSTIYLVNTISKVCFKSNKKLVTNIIALIMVILSLQFVPYAVESFYWYNGSMYYTFFYSIMLYLIAFILRLYNTENKKARIVYTTLICICSILVGGSNYVTALISTIILVMFAIYTFTKQKRDKYNVLTALILTVVCFAISILAPGNKYRQAGCDSSLGAVQAIIESIKYAITYFGQWTTPTIIISFVFIIPLIYVIISKNKFEYKFPILVTIFTFGLFAAQFTPPLYAMNHIGGTRLLDIVYYSYLWLLLINITYYMGWAKNKINKNLPENTNIEETIEKTFKKYALIYFGICSILFAVVFINSDYKNTTTIWIVNEFKSGTLQLYKQEMRDRIDMYNDETITDVVVKDLTVKPKLLYCGDLSTDVDNWINTAMSRYYNKNSIVMKMNNERK